MNITAHPSTRFILFLSIFLGSTSCSARYHYLLPELPHTSRITDKIAYSVEIIDAPLNKELYEKHNRLERYEEINRYLIERNNRFRTTVKQSLQECGYNEPIWLGSVITQNTSIFKLFIAITAVPTLN